MKDKTILTAALITGGMLTFGSYKLHRWWVRSTAGTEQIELRLKDMENRISKLERLCNAQ